MKTTPTPHDALFKLLMTIAQKLEEKWRQEGVLEGKLQVARTMLANGIDRDSVMRMTGMTAGDLAQICH